MKLLPWSVNISFETLCLDIIAINCSATAGALNYLKVLLLGI